MAFHSQQGNIVQTVRKFKGNYFSTNSMGYVDITDLSLSITPKFANSEILVSYSLGAAGTNQSNLDHGQTIRVMRRVGSSNSFSDVNQLNGSGDGSRQRISMKGVGWAFNADHMPGGVGMTGLDNPTYSVGDVLTYKLQVCAQSSSYVFVLNGNAGNDNTANLYDGRACSHLFLQEIGGS